MSWRRRRKEEQPDETARARLWLDLRWSFEDDDGTRHASADVGFDELTGADILRIWELMNRRATSISKRHVWDRDREPTDESLALSDAIPLLAGGELGYISVHVDGLESRRVPPLVLELWEDAVSMYWWVGDDGWNEGTVAELAELLGELHALVPHARLAYDYKPDVDEFWGRVNSYLATTR